MKSHLLPKAWIGYGKDAKTGEFLVRICSQCEEFEQAKKEAKPLAIRIQPCPTHYNETLEKQIK